MAAGCVHTWLITVFTRRRGTDGFGCISRSLSASFAHAIRMVLPLVLVIWTVDVVAVADDVDFSRDIRPILSNNCFICHGPDEAAREADLRLDTREGALADRGGYHAIVPHEPSASVVLQRVAAVDAGERMPPEGTGLELTDREMMLLERWIEQGAAYDQHWAFVPVRRPATPDVASTWPRNAIDAFVLEELERRKFTPSPEAPRHTLIRRVYLDLLGLPPTPEEVSQFIDDTSPDAYERMVDRALASLHYGERWGRHWLDQARYADTNGYAVDAPRPIWPYRDWVIEALNEDMPFDQFTIEQLAGDLLPDATRDQLVATGFHRNTLINEEGGTDIEQFRVEAVVDRVNTTGAVWLGLTLGCAECHTHKYDPITQHEYYQLFAFFNSTEDENRTPPALQLTTPEQEERLAEFDQQVRAARRALTSYDRQREQREEELADSEPDAEAKRAELAAQLEASRKARREYAAGIPETMVLRERSEPRETHVHERGDFLRHGDRVEPGTPAVLPPLPETDARPTRLDLARWLVDRQNPLTARVTVNRIWARYFGQGVVETENDFGLQGTLPTHPELLDWLAAEFMEGGWSMKRLHRLILHSATYRQSSHRRHDLETVDPLNKLLARQARLRVEAEIIRDLGLAASGLLHARIGGPSVYPPQPDDVYAFTQFRRDWPTSTGPDRYRRGMYTFFARSMPYPMLTTFDTPVFNTTCTFRLRSNTPLQSLALANDEAMVEISQALGERIRSHLGCDQERIRFAIELCFSRPADGREVERLDDYVNQQRAEFAATPEDAESVAGEAAGESSVEAAAWTMVARVLVNLDEFIVRE